VCHIEELVRALPDGSSLIPLVIGGRDAHPACINTQAFDRASTHCVYAEVHGSPFLAIVKNAAAFATAEESAN